MKSLVIGSLLLASSVFAETKVLEVRAPFEELEDRMESTVTAELVDELRPFARNLSRRLNIILDNATAVGINDAEELIVGSLESIIYTDNQKFDEVLSREILERAILIHRMMKQETEGPEGAYFGTTQMRVRLLTRAIEKAVNTYVAADEAFFVQISQGAGEDVNYAAFGEDFFAYLVELNKSVFDATAQYRLERLAIKFLQYDYARDTQRQAYATNIVDIHDTLAGFAETQRSDLKAVLSLRGLKKFRNTLGVELKYSYMPERPKKVYRNGRIGDIDDLTKLMGQYSSSVYYNDEKNALDCLVDNQIALNNAFAQVGNVNDISNRASAMCALAEQGYDKYYNIAGNNVYYNDELNGLKCLTSNHVESSKAFAVVGNINDISNRKSFLCALAASQVAKQNDELYYYVDDIYHNAELRAVKCLIDKGYTDNTLYAQATNVNDVSNRADVICNMPSRY